MNPAQAQVPEPNSKAVDVRYRTNNFYLFFYSKMDPESLEVWSKMRRRAEPHWTQLESERPGEFGTARSAVDEYLRVCKAFEQAFFKECSLGNIDMKQAEELEAQGKPERVRIANAMNAAINPIFDELVRRGVDPKVLCC